MYEDLFVKKFPCFIQLLLTLMDNYIFSQLLPTTKTSTSSNDTTAVSTPNGPSASKASASNGPKAPATNGPKAPATNGPKAPVTNGLKDASSFGTKPAEVDQTKKDDKVLQYYIIFCRRYFYPYILQLI